MPKKIFNGNRFSKEIVVVDNAVFLNCHFEHCTLRYSRGPWEIDGHCSFSSDTTFSMGGAGWETLRFLKYFDMIKPGRFAEPSEKKPNRVN